MRRFIKNNEKWASLFTNHQVEQLKDKNIREIHSNHLAKVLLWHIETYQEIIYSLLEENEQLLNDRKI